MVVQLGWLQHSFSGSAATSRSPKSCRNANTNSHQQMKNSHYALL
jgi:hypothetical protein